MNSVRAIMGATQVGGKGSLKGMRKNKRTYGGLQMSSYNFDCNCADNEKGNPTGYASMSPDPRFRSKLNTGVMPSLLGDPVSVKPTSVKPNPYAFLDNRKPTRISSSPVRKKINK